MPQPDRATIANTAFLLSDLSPAAAASSIRMIREAVYQGLQRNGWHYQDAAVFSIIFVEQIAARLHEIADAARQLH